ncbi:MAG: hypothetical protein OK456_05665 [Thaumarchaeota archaeon]|nr:hypothetical protein [Nitrososphaerota archaeon]
METLDFGRSFFTFSIDLDKKPPKTISAKPRYPSNWPRVVLEATLQLTHLKTKKRTDYILSASCKAENVAEPKGLWMSPNADCCFVASKDEFMVIKSWARRGTGVKLWPPGQGVQPERNPGWVKDSWPSLSIDPHKVDGDLLKTPDEVVEATFANRPLVARMEYDDGGYHVRIDHPVKTINVNAKYHYFQTDTGPLLLPDFTPKRVKAAKLQIETLDLAFEAYNSPTWAEFVINVPTKVGPDLEVDHYSKFRRIDRMKNSMIALR